MDKKIFLELMKGVPMTDAEKEFRAWIKLNKETLVDRTAHEIAQVAILSGFDAEIVFSVLSSIKDALGGTQVESRARMQMFRWDVAVEDFHRVQDEKNRIPELDLMPLWRSVHFYQTNEEPKQGGN